MWVTCTTWCGGHVQLDVGDMFNLMWGTCSTWWQAWYMSCSTLQPYTCHGDNLCHVQLGDKLGTCHVLPYNLIHVMVTTLYMLTTLYMSCSTWWQAWYMSCSTLQPCTCHGDNLIHVMFNLVTSLVHIYACLEGWPSGKGWEALFQGYDLWTTRIYTHTFATTCT